MSDGWKTMRVRVARFEAIMARAKAEGISASAWIDRALDAALSSASPPAGGSKPSGQGRASSSTASRRAPGHARPAAAAGDGQASGVDRQPSPGLVSATEANLARQAKLNEAKAKRK